MAQPLDIRRTIEANRAELERYGEVFARRPKTGPKGGRPATEYWLNEPQAILICMFSRTDAAADVREEVIKVYMAYRRSRAGRREEAIPPPGYSVKVSSYYRRRTRPPPIRAKPPCHRPSRPVRIWAVAEAVTSGQATDFPHCRKFRH